MQVAEGVDSLRLLTWAESDFCCLILLQSDQTATARGFDIDEANVVGWCHRVRFLADLDLQLLVATLFHYGQMILILTL